MADPQNEPPKRVRWKRWAKVSLPVLASLLGLVSLKFLTADFMTHERLSELLRPLGVWAPVVFVTSLMLRPLLFLPGQVFAGVGGMLFGAFLGSVYALVGSFLATAVVYVLSRRFGDRLMKRFAGKKLPAVQDVAQRHAFKLAFIACINPLIPTDVMIVAAASAGARFWPTALGVLVGTVPGTVLTAQFGAALGHGDTVLTVASAIGLLASLALGVWLGRRISREIGEFEEVDPEEGSGPLEQPGPLRRRRRDRKGHPKGTRKIPAKASVPAKVKPTTEGIQPPSTADKSLSRKASTSAGA